MRATPILLSLLVFAGAAAPAHAQSRRELDERLQAVERQLRAGPGEDAALRNLDRINSLEGQIRTLTDQVERLEFRNRQLETRIETLQEDFMSSMRSGPSAFGDEEGEFAEIDPDGPTRLSGPDGGDDGEDFAIVNPDDPFADERRAATQPLGAVEDPYAGRGGNAPSGSGEALGDVEYDSTGDDPDLLFARGRTRLFDGDFSSALASFAEFLDIAPDDSRAGEAWFWVGSIYRSEEQPVEAADALVKSLQADPEGSMAAEAMVQLGAALAEMGRTDEACRTFAEAARRYPDMDPSVRSTAVRERRSAGCS